jgi:hypothetical protein
MSRHVDIFDGYLIAGYMQINLTSFPDENYHFAGAIIRNPAPLSLSPP